MTVEHVGPGGVSNSYGVRTTTSKVVYENDNTYQDVFIPTGSVPVTARSSGPGGVNIVPAPAAPTARQAVGVAGAATGLATERSKLAALWQAGAVRAHLYGNSMVISAYSHILLAAQQSQGRISIEANGAVNGYSTANTIAAISANGFAPTANVGIYQEAYNDAVDGVSLAAHTNNVLSIAETAKNQGLVPLFVVSPPADDARAATVNAYCVRDFLVLEKFGVPTLNPFWKLVDTDGTYQVGFESDDIHPVRAAYQIAATEMLSQLDGSSPVVWYPRGQTGQGIGGSNILQMTDTDSNGLPDGWSTISLTTPTYTLSAMPEAALGNKCSVGLSQSATGYVYRDFTSGFSVGDTIRLCGFAGLPATSNAQITVNIRFMAGSTTLSDVIALRAVGALSTRWYQRDAVVPATCDKIRALIVVETATTGAYTATLEFAATDILNISALTA